MPADAATATIYSPAFEAKARTQGSSGAAVPSPRATTPIRQVARGVDPSRWRLAHRELAERLAADSTVGVTVIRGRSQQPLPRSAELLLELERVTRRLPGSRLTDRIDAGRLALADCGPQD